MKAALDALAQVSKELEKHNPNAPCLHFARGILAAAEGVVSNNPSLLPHLKVLESTAKAFGFTVDDLSSKRRTQPLAEARFAAMLALRRSGESLPRIGSLLVRDHTTVLHGVARAEELERTSETYAAAVKAICDGKVQSAFVDLPVGRKQALRAIYPDIAAYYQSGHTILECSSKFKVATTTVSKALASENVKPRAKGQRRSGGVDERIEEMLEMRSTGATFEQIGNRFKISRERVRQIAAQAGKAEEFAERPPTPQEKAHLEKYRAGGSLIALAADLDVSVPTAKRRLTAAGIPIRKSRKRLQQRAARKATAEKVAAKYNRGDKLADIKTEFGFNNNMQIYTHLAIAGCKPNRIQAERA